MLLWIDELQNGLNGNADAIINFPPLSGSQERQDKLREMGFVDILHKLTQASDPNLSDRWATVASHETHSFPIVLSRMDSLCVSAGRRQRCNST